MNQKPTLLIVEDDPGVQETLTDCLCDIEAEIITANNGREGLEKVKSQTVHAILSDINMPHMTGFEMFEELKKLGFKTPLIYLSAYVNNEYLNKANDLGAFAYIQKPFNLEFLEQKVKDALNQGLK